MLSNNDLTNIVSWLHEKWSLQLYSCHFEFSLKKAPKLVLFDGMGKPLAHLNNHISSFSLTLNVGMGFLDLFQRIGSIDHGR